MLIGEHIKNYIHLYKPTKFNDQNGKNIDKLKERYEFSWVLKIYLTCRRVPKSGGIVTLSSFTVFWACVYFVTTTLVLIFKREENTLNNENEKNNTIVKNYYRLYQISKLPAVRWYVLFLLTKGIGFAALLGVSDIKFVEYGLAKETKALLTVPYQPISIFLTIFISRWTGSHKPMSIWMKTFFLALPTSALVMLMLWVTGTVKDADGGFPSWYFPILLIVDCASKACQACQTVLIVSYVAFCAKISDPDYGSIRNRALELTTRRTNCQYCNRNFESFERLNKHLKWCNLGLRKRGYMKRHPHRPTDNFICDLCGRTFKSFYSIHEHMKEVHLSKLSSKCRLCNKMYPSRYYLAKHLKRHEEAEAAGIPLDQLQPI